MQISEGTIDLTADYKDLLISTLGPYYSEEDMEEFKAISKDGAVNFDKFKKILTDRGLQTLE